MECLHNATALDQRLLENVTTAKVKKKHNDVTTIGCEKCGNWFHGACDNLDL